MRAATIHRIPEMTVPLSRARPWELAGDQQSFSVWVGRLAPVSAADLREELLAYCERAGLRCTIEAHNRWLETKLVVIVDGPASEIARFRAFAREYNCLSLGTG